MQKDKSSHERAGISKEELELAGISKKDFDSLSRTVFKSAVYSLLNDGILTIDDVNDKATLSKKLLLNLKKIRFEIVVDHADNLLETAKSFKNNGDINKAKLFYATFIEHELNKIIVHVCERKNLDRKTINEIIKSINIIGKLTWFPTLLGIPKITDKHKKVVLKMSDERNAYIHYKHNPSKESESVSEREKGHIEVEQIIKTISYFRQYSSRIIFDKRKGLIDSLLKKTKSANQ